ncbi:hypothetical protein KDM87_06795 [Undibacterium sp. FT147W]|uniref:Uncharacterized protein n=1 Tax=Undibacterium rivi TaxID=2828729 RepID=A0ABS5H109_9BURK|nr:hypothetical protein [Undibacterium rivi]MBR7792303.1 hypothetical protein [Undibacterium rivi]
MIVRASQKFSGGAYQIGDAAYIPDSGTVITKPDQTKFLRSGTVALSTLYPQAAKIESLMVHGTGISTLPATTSITAYAYDGNNTVVLCYGDATNVMVSTNKGVSFSLIPHNLGIAATSVIRTGTRFIVAGCDGTNVKCSYSTTGATFTAGGTRPFTGSAGTRMSWDGAIAVIAVSQSGVATSTIFTTTDGATLTARSIPAQIYSTSSSTVRIICNPSAGANRWLLVGVGNTVAARSTAADASAWELVVLPVTTIVSTSAGLGLFVCATATNFYASPTGATGSWTATANQQVTNSSSVSGAFGVVGDMSIQFDGTRFLIGTASSSSSTFSQQFAYTTDFKNFTTRQTIPQSIGTTYNPSYLTAVPISTNLLLLPASANSPSDSYIYAANWFTSSEYVGSSVPFWMAQVAGGAGIPQRTIYGYVRVD